MALVVDIQIIYNFFYIITNAATIRIPIQMSWYGVRVFLKLDYHRIQNVYF